jgi:hypothetical protein
MKSFFAQDEKDRLRNLFLGAADHSLAVFKMEPEEKQRVMERQIKQHEFGLDRIDLALAYMSKKHLDELAEPEPRQKFLKFLEFWFTYTQLDFDSVAAYIDGTFGYHQEEKNFDLSKKLDDVLEMIGLAGQFTALYRKFPHMVMGNQLSQIIVADNEMLKSLLPQFDFLNKLTLEDIAKGNIDYRRLEEVNKIYSPFSPTLNTLQDMERVKPIDGRSSFLILNYNFPKLHKYDYRGVIEQIPDDLFKMVTSLDPRIYEFGYLGVDLRNWIAAIVMTGERGYPALKGTCQHISEGDFRGFEYNLKRNLFVNLAMMINSRELASYDKFPVDLKAHMVCEPVKYAAEHLKKAADKAYIQLPPARLKEAAFELMKTGWMVAYRYMRKEQNYLDVNSTPRARNPGLISLHPFGHDSMYIPAARMWVDQIHNDMQRIIKEGTRKMVNSGKFYHDNKAFFDKWKENPSSVSPKSIEKILKGIREGMQDKEFAAYMDTVLGSLNHVDKEILQGYLEPSTLHYLSSVQSGRVIVEEINAIDHIHILLGYANNNCLKPIDILRYHSNPDARIYSFWLGGDRVGMSYDLLISHNGLKSGDSSKDPLIDSIELSDLLFENVNKVYTLSTKERIPDNYVAKTFVTGYLFARLQHSDNGIYLLPESNNLHVRRAMNDFIVRLNGKKAIFYDGTRVQTDTDFDAMPYWIDKSALTGNIISGFYDMTNGKIVQAENAALADPMLSPEANTVMQTELKRILDPSLTVPKANGS